MLDIAYFSKQGTNQINGEAILHLHSQNINLFALAEGVGEATVKNLSANFSLGVIQKLFLDNNDITIREIFKNLSLELQRFSTESTQVKTMLTLSIIKEGQVYIGHIGNSRVYHITDGKILQKTDDQSHLQRSISQTIMDRESLKPVISGNGNYTIEEHNFPIEKGEKIILLSDGIYESISEASDLRQLVETSNNIKTLAFKIQQVIEFYEIEDDYSAICIEAL